MKCTIPEISWHNRDPVLSVDIQPKPLESDGEKNIIRLASGGSDSHVLIWYISHKENGPAQLELATDLTRHQRAVNVVRWSPSGEFLASGDDESVIFIWKLKNESEPVNILDDNNEQDKENWIINKTLRGHIEDVYDLSWSMDSLSLISGSVDNSAIVWDIKKGKSKVILNDHKGFVQGVAWDPKNQYLATLATDRFFRMFDVNTNKVCRRVNKSTYPVPESSPFFNKPIRLFHDDTLLTFYRRFCFTPDGELIIVPSGCSDVVVSSDASNNADKQENIDKPNQLINTTYIFTRYSTKRPAVVIPSPDHFTVAARCCPLLFELRPHDENKPPVFALPYRMIFAIATKSSVYLYDTQQQMPFGCISNIHYARLTDMTWSADGNILVVSSMDGFCTLISFEAGELGTVYEKPIELMELNEKDDSNVNASKENVSENNAKSPSDDNKPSNHTSLVPNKIGVKKSPKASNTNDLHKSTSDIDKIIVQIPETIIATAENFESPEYKGKQATPIAVRRAPRTNPSTPVSESKKTQPKSESKTPNTQKPKLIAVRRQPRSILPSPAIADKRTDDQDEALDAWPIPIETTQKHNSTKINPETSQRTHNIRQLSQAMVSEKTEDMRLIYDGDSESILIKATTNADVDVDKETVTQTSETKNGSNDVNMKQDIVCTDPIVTPDAKNPKTPRRVQLRTISTPKSKKKIIN